MSVLKKIMIGLFTIILVVMGFISYSRYQSAQELKMAFKNDDKIQISYHLMASERYAKDIRQAGFTIPPIVLFDLMELLTPWKSKGVAFKN